MGGTGGFALPCYGLADGIFPGGSECIVGLAIWRPGVISI